MLGIMRSAEYFHMAFSIVYTIEKFVMQRPILLTYLKPFANTKLILLYLSFEFLYFFGFVSKKPGQLG